MRCTLLRTSPPGAQSNPNLLHLQFSHIPHPPNGTVIRPTCMRSSLETLAFPCETSTAITGWQSEQLNYRREKLSEMRGQRHLTRVASRFLSQREPISSDLGNTMAQNDCSEQHMGRSGGDRSHTLTRANARACPTRGGRAPVMGESISPSYSRERKNWRHSGEKYS